ncbi:MAG TPA: hypothetical protein VJ808_06920 [Gemmatimonadales bacterium]|nr:hypothetical protein [Gemmatimonadales bacterium]
MRSVPLLQLAILVGAAAGCQPDSSPQSGKIPERDLTLVTHISEAKIASPVEIQQPGIDRRAPRSSPAARRMARPSGDRKSSVRLAEVVAPVPSLAASEPASQPVSPTSSTNDRELPPGKTVTLIPASSGPSPSADRGGDLPRSGGHTMVGRGGGKCGGRGRGPGIGIAGVPRPDFR